MTPAAYVSFPNRQGLRLAGMLHEPSPSSARGVCVLLLSPGIKGRVGPHRLYLKMAARLVPMGFHVLRFDFFGLGDSDGDLSEGIMADVYTAVQLGRYVDDTRAAMDWMEREYGVCRFVASGLCGGSITGLLTAEDDPRIISVLGLAMPVILDGDPALQQRFLTRGQLDKLRRGYLDRLLRPRAWLRFLTGRSNYAVLLKSLGRRPEQRKLAPENTAPDNTNPRFAPAFFSLVGSGRPIILIFSGADRLGWEFNEKFAERHARRLEEYRSLFEVHTIPNANHVLSDPAWVDEMLDVAARWLETNNPPR